MSTANKTPNLSLPQYTGSDKFDLEEINKGYLDIDSAYKEIIDFREEIPKVNASAEIIEARDGEKKLYDKIKKIDSSLETKAKQSDLIITNNSVANLENTKATKTEVDVERKRIDNFTSLTSGSTTGDAELIDGRIGADGKKYSNIGNSLRGQINKINSDLNNIIVTNYFDKNNLNVSNGYYDEDGKTIIQNNVYSVSNNIYITDSKYLYLNTTALDGFTVYMYNSNENHITSTNISQNLITIPDNSSISYCKIGVYNSVLNTLMITKYPYNGDYFGYGTTVVGELDISKYNVEINTIASDALNSSILNSSIESKNLFDSTKTITGKYINSDGDIATETDSELAYIKVKTTGNVTISEKNGQTMALYGCFAIAKIDNTTILKKYQSSTIDSVLTKTTNGYVINLTEFSDYPYVNILITYRYKSLKTRQLQIEYGDVETGYELFTKPSIYELYGVKFRDDRLYSTLEGLTGVFHGDSITAGGTVNGSMLDYPSIVSKKLALGNYINLAKSGSTLAKRTHTNDNGVNIVESISTFPDSADFIYIAVGVNDFAFYGVEIGQTDSTDVTEFWGALNTIIPLLQQKYPTKPIIFATPIKYHNGKNNLGYVLNDYCNAIRNACDKFGIICCDMNRLFGYNPLVAETKNVMFDSIGLHPYSVVGMSEMANRVSGFIKNLFG